MLTSTLPFDHFELFGLRQGLKMGSALRFVPFGLVKSGHYALVRHPLMTGFLIMAFCPLKLTIGRFLIAGIIGLYINVSLFLKSNLQKRLRSLSNSLKNQIWRKSLGPNTKLIKNQLLLFSLAYFLPVRFQARRTNKNTKTLMALISNLIYKFRHLAAAFDSKMD